VTVIPACGRDPTLTRLEAEVLETWVEGGRPFVVLADTVLHPEGGGQPADRGTLAPAAGDGGPGASVPVVDVRRSGGAVRHFLAAPAPALSAGSTARSSPKPGARPSGGSRTWSTRAGCRAS
jgi:Ser-tRNA(Ala) deacylase AlaX